MTGLESDGVTRFENYDETNQCHRDSGGRFGVNSGSGHHSNNNLSRGAARYDNGNCLRLQSEIHSNLSDSNDYEYDVPGHSQTCYG